MAQNEKDARLLGKRLHRYRLERDLTQEQLANLLHLCAATIYKAEHGVPVNDRTAFSIKKLIGGNANA